VSLRNNVANMRCDAYVEDYPNQSSVTESPVAFPPEKGGVPCPHIASTSIGRDDHFWSDDGIECADDQEAIQRVQQTMDGRDIELRERGRFIVRLPGDNRSASEVHAAHTSTGTAMRTALKKLGSRYTPIFSTESAPRKSGCLAFQVSMVGMLTSNASARSVEKTAR
jgi:hypothetical protein